MYNMMIERKCRGVHLRKGRWEELRKVCGGNT